MKYKLRVHIRLETQPYGQGALEVSEEMILEVSDFLDACVVLGKFHELKELMRIERGK